MFDLAQILTPHFLNNSHHSAGSRRSDPPEACLEPPSVALRPPERLSALPYRLVAADSEITQPMIVHVAQIEALPPPIGPGAEDRSDDAAEP